MGRVEHLAGFEHWGSGAEPSSSGLGHYVERAEHWRQGAEHRVEIEQKVTLISEQVSGQLLLVSPFVKFTIHVILLLNKVHLCFCSKDLHSRIIPTKGRPNLLLRTCQPYFPWLPKIPRFVLWSLNINLFLFTTFSSAPLLRYSPVQRHHLKWKTYVIVKANVTIWKCYTVRKQVLLNPPKPSSL